MPLEIVIKKMADGTLQAATPMDQVSISSLTIGKGYTARITNKSERSYQHHKLFFGGLLPLAFSYYQPSGGMVSKSERNTVLWVMRQIARSSQVNERVLIQAAEEALLILATQRASKYGTVESFRKWLTIEAGYFHIVETPNTIIREANSISFAKMNQDEFNVFFKNCFDVVWNMMLKKVYPNEEAALAAVQELMELSA